MLVYARTSTDDLQSPEDSLAWQVSRAETLVAGRAIIVGVIHETDTSRSIPWARRRRVAELLAQLYLPDRTWDGIVVGEPQRAFGSAAQVQDVLPRLADGDAQLWVPEVGGPVDPGSEAHDIMLNLFGGLSRAERKRLQERVKAAKEQQVTTGRFQGGRPPYGYRLVSTGVPHPNAEKARWGATLTCLEVDPDTAKWVQQIFAWRVEGLGYRTIATRLDVLGAPCPSAHDRDRNPHRTGRAWGTSTVGAIVANPEIQRDRRLRPVAQSGASLRSRQPIARLDQQAVPAPEDTWVMVEGTVPALVSADDWLAAQPEKAPTPNGGRRQDTPSRYALRGLVVCAACQRIMQGNAIRRSQSTAIHYRCTYRSQYAGDADHPKSLAIAENRLLGPLDDWLGRLFDEDHVDDTITVLLAADRPVEGELPAVVRAKSVAADAQ